MTAFTKKVYQVVLSIPLGEVRSYRWVAKKAGKPGASRAVGQILKRNPYTLIIPCHRVIKANGQLGGYSRGIKAKRKLLELERDIKNIISGEEILSTKKRIRWYNSRNVKK